jgi:UDP-N-acetylmuramate dehydrogenase
MMIPLTLLTPFPLTALNTLGLTAQARAGCEVQSLTDLQQLCTDPELKNWPRLVLGGGSNLVLTQDFPGLVLHMCSRGIALVGEPEAGQVRVRASAGENWHGLVEWCLAHGLGGLENLSLIPGTVGAAPIQNIGAYGVELQQVLHSVTYFDWLSQEIITLSNNECRFGYRDSIFKHALKDRAVIVEVVLALPQIWRPRLQYAELAQAMAGVAEPTAQQISAAVCAIRRRKLPDPAVLGNVGSFFKNPVLQPDAAARVRQQFPGVVSYPQADGTVKLAAGWLIDQCGWKGKRLGPMGVYSEQALVLVNHGGARGEHVLALAQQIQADVLARFGVALEPEPLFI